MKSLVHYPYFNGYMIESWEWINNFIPHFIMCTYLLMLELKSIQVRQKSPSWMTYHIQRWHSVKRAIKSNSSKTHRKENSVYFLKLICKSDQRLMDWCWGFVELYQNTMPKMSNEIWHLTSKLYFHFTPGCLTHCDQVKYICVNTLGPHWFR